MTNSLFTISLGISAVGNFCVLNLYEQYRLSCKEAVLDSHVHPNILMILLALATGAIVSFGSGLSYFLGAQESESAIDEKFSSVNIVFSALLPIFCSSLGFYVCTRNRIFVKDEFDTINDFIAETRTKNIKEIRAMKHKSEVLSSSLRTAPISFCTGGFLVGSGLCCSQYLILSSFVDRTLSFSPGIVFSSILAYFLYGVTLCWMLFRLLSLYPFNENMRFICLIVLSILSSAAHALSMTSMEVGAIRGLNPVLGLTTSDIENVFLPIMAVAVLALLGVVSSDMRIWYVKLNYIISEADDTLLNLKRDLTRKGHFVDEYFELRRIDGYALRHRSPDKGATYSNDGSPASNRSPSPDGKRRMPTDSPSCQKCTISPGTFSGPDKSSCQSSNLFPEKKVSFQCDSRKTDSTYLVSDKSFGTSVKSDLTSCRTLRSYEGNPIDEADAEEVDVGLAKVVDIEANYGCMEPVDIVFDENPMNAADGSRVRADGWLSGNLLSTLFHYGTDRIEG